MDLSLLPELGGDRQHRQAVALDPAVPAALADGFVNDDPARRLRQFPALAQPTGLRGAPLVVDDHGDAGDGPQPLLDAGQRVPAEHRYARCPLRLLTPCLLTPAIARRVLGADHNLSDALSLQRAGQRRHVHQPDDVLAASHGNSRVVEDLEGNVRARRHGGPDGERPGVRQRAVAKVLDEVRLGDERLQPDPRNALGPHRRRRQVPASGVAGLEVHDPVAADAAPGQHPVRQHRRPVVRTAAAVSRRAARHRQRRGCRQEGKAGPFRGRGQSGPEPAQDLRHRVGVQLPGQGGEGLAGAVALARDRGRDARLVQDSTQLHLDEGALFLDDGDLADRRGELEDRLLDEGVGQAEAKDADARARGVADAQAREGVGDIEIGLARADDAEAGTRSRA